jgi:hypothetical protein
MEGISLGTLAKQAITITKGIVPALRRWHAERIAADASPIDVDILDKYLDEGLNHIRRIDDDDAWWRRTLDWLAHQYVTPDYLSHPYIRDWLKDPHVRHDLKTLARARLLEGSFDESAIRKKVSERYSEISFDAPFRAEGHIDAILNILLSGAGGQALGIARRREPRPAPPRPGPPRRSP